MPKYVSGALPNPLTYLYDKATLSMSFPDLLNRCDEVYNSISLSVQQASRVEEDTRQQSNSKVWFEQRSGRVTASKLHSVLHTDMVHDSLDGTTNVTTTEVDDTVSTTVTVTSEVPTSTQDSLQVLDEDSGADSEEDDTLWCYCQQNLQEELVGCDNPSCKIKWFHLSYLQLKLSQLPKGKWYCPDCHKEKYQSKCKGKAEQNK